LNLKIPIISNFLGKRSIGNQTIKNFDSDIEERFKALLLGTSIASKAGVEVNSETAVKVSAVFACVDYIASTISSLPCTLYRRLERGKTPATNLDLYYLLHDSPNPETTAIDFWEMYLWNLELTGYGFAYIKRDKNGFIKELWNVPTKNVSIYRNSKTGEKFYIIRYNDGTESPLVYPENMMVTVGKRFTDADKALDPIAIARNAMGLGLALEEYASKYFANGASVSGIVEYPGALKTEKLEDFKADFQKTYQGLQKSFNVMFLENGAKFQKISNSPEESQAIEARKFQVLEVCRFFRVPPHKVFELDRSTFNNIEQQNIEAVQTCLTPRCVKLEQTIHKDLLTLKEKRKYFAKFKTNALLRGDTDARRNFYNTMLQNGVFSPNNVLELEDMDVYEGGDIHFVNGAMIPVESLKDYLEFKMKGGVKGEEDSEQEKSTESTE